MTVREAIEKTNVIRPGHPYTNDMLTEWLSKLDGRICLENLVYDESGKEYVTGNETLSEGQRTTPEYKSYQSDSEKILVVPSPYDEMYLFYLASMIDFSDRDWDGYSVTMVMYNTAFDRWTKWNQRNLKCGAAKLLKL